MLMQTGAPGLATATESVVEAVPVPASQYLMVQLGAERFGMGLASVREILQYRDLTTVPLVPPLIRGVINLRGAVVPVIDLAVRLGRTAGPVTEQTCIVIVELESTEHLPRGYKMGLVVDAVSQVQELPEADKVPTPEFGTHLRPDFVQAMGRIGGQFVVLLQLERVLWLPEVAIMGALR